jgi:hypothetical protein
MKLLSAAGALVAAGLLAVVGFASPPRGDRQPDVPSEAGKVNLVAHEWGTFTSFSGSDGVPVGFRPDNSGLPDFVYREVGPVSKDGLLRGRLGTVSMETPVIYLYADKPTRASVRVDFPQGWVTEWYPAAAPARAARGPDGEGRGIRWDVRVLAGEAARLPRVKSDNPYFHARETDADAVEVDAPRREGAERAGTSAQREKFLFYRGVGKFPPPVTARGLGGGKVRVTNATRERVRGLVLVTVRGGKVGFRPLPDLAAGAETDAAIPEPAGGVAELAERMEKDLTATGLYPKEARAMVRTWEEAWFGEDGTRVFYLVPRANTDELLPLTIDPKPAEVVRVLVGRHEFLTPEREAEAARIAARVKAARAELDAAEKELKALGRFAEQAREMAEQRLSPRPGGRR